MDLKIKHILILSSGHHETFRNFTLVRSFAQIKAAKAQTGQSKEKNLIIVKHLRF